jgi:hypothetical protein
MLISFEEEGRYSLPFKISLAFRFGGNNEMSEIMQYGWPSQLHLCLNALPMWN